LAASFLKKTVYYILPTASLKINQLQGESSLLAGSFHLTAFLLNCLEFNQKLNSWPNKLGA
jgi:hypothetical protein